jgi:hypothetical protein
MADLGRARVPGIGNNKVDTGLTNRATACQQATPFLKSHACGNSDNNNNNNDNINNDNNDNDDSINNNNNTLQRAQGALGGDGGVGA